MYNNAGTIGGAAAGGSVAAAQTLPDTGGLALMPLTGTYLDWVLLPVAAFAFIGGGCALLRLLPKGEA
jgi:hypothetical protein